MILLLDFDGVLHPETGDEQLTNLCQLWAILRACPHVEVVFSTSWREAYSMEHLVEFVTFGDGEDLEHRFVGATPQIIATRGNYSSTVTDYSREQECRLWIEGNQPGQPWIALDDHSDWFSPRCPHLYLVNYKTGLTEADASSLIEELQAWEVRA